MEGLSLDLSKTTPEALVAKSEELKAKANQLFAAGSWKEAEGQQSSPLSPCFLSITRFLSSLLSLSHSLLLSLSQFLSLALYLSHGL